MHCVQLLPVQHYSIAIFAMVLCLSICLSRFGIVSKWLNVSSCSCYRTRLIFHCIWKGISFSRYKAISICNFVPASGFRKILLQPVECRKRCQHNLISGRSQFITVRGRHWCDASHCTLDKTYNNNNNNISFNNH